jgi:hypothetical protein
MLLSSNATLRRWGLRVRSSEVLRQAAESPSIQNYRCFSAIAVIHLLNTRFAGSVGRGLQTEVSIQY